MSQAPFDKPVVSAGVAKAEDDALRRSGLDLIGDIPWGTHFCQFYRSVPDLLEILVPYFKAGLENNEFCMWVTSQPLPVEEAEVALRLAMPDLDRYIEQGQIEFLSYNQWYTKSGVFDADLVLRAWVDKLEGAVERGFDGLRLTGNTFWLEKKDWGMFTDYEEVINSVIGRYRMIAACTYSLEKCNSVEIIDVVKNHQFALIQKDGRWTIIESQEHRKTEEALRASEQRYRTLFNGMTEGFAIHEIITDESGAPVDYRFLDINPAFERLTGLNREVVVGRTVKEVMPEIETYWIESYGKVALTGEPIHFENYSGALNRHYDVYAYSPAPRQFAVVFLDITSRRVAEQKHSTILETSHSGYWLVDLNGRLLEVNDAYARMSGYTRDELLGMPVSCFEAATPATDVVQRIRRVREVGHDEYESRHRRKDGSVYDVDMHATYLDIEGGRVVVFVWNISDRKKSEQALQESRKDLNRAQAVSHVGSWRLDVVRNELIWSDENHRIFGLPKGPPMTYQTFLSVVHPEDREYVQEKWSAALRGEPYDIEHRIVVGNEIKWVRERAELEFDGKGVLCGGFGTTQDVTERKAADEVRRRIAQELERSNRDLEQFAYVASHDLQEPLRVVIGFMGLLRSRYKEQLDAKAGQYIDMSVEAADRMSRLIAGLLDYSRAGTGATRREPTPCEGALKQALANLQSAIEDSGARISCDPLPVTLADPTQLTQLFQNIIGNAIKFRRDGIPPEIHIGAAHQGAEWVLSVRDNGIGIAPDQNNRIFEVFQRLHPRDKFPGTGIGLAVCKKIVERARGRIWAEANDGPGSTFLFTLPA
jgi:PAS domain S-box-containing protein